MVEAPDEFAHYWVTKFLVTHFALPTPSEISAGGASAVYGSLPQVGYLPHAACALILPMFDIALAERFGSVIMGLIAILVSYRISKIIFPNEQFRSLALPLCLTFHPQFVFVNTYCNNDSTAIALASVLLLVSIDINMKKPSVRQVALAGVLCGLIALSKYSALALVPVACVSVITASWIYGLKLKETAALISIMGLSAGLVASPCLVRNYFVFDGDLLGAQTMRKVWSETYHRSTEPQNLWGVLKQKVWWQQLFTSFWAVFGYQSRYVPNFFYGGFLVFIGAACGGWASTLINQIKQSKGKLSLDSVLGERSSLKLPAAWLLIVVAIVANVAGLMYAVVQNLGGPQGRYLFASEIPFMLVILGGLFRISKRWSEWLVWGFVGWNALTLIYSSFMLYNTFGFRTKLY